MTSSSAGSRPESGDFLRGYLENLKKERVPGAGDSAMKGEVRDDIVGKVERDVLKVWYGWPRKS